MANVAIWPGSSSFAPGQTPFGYFDNDPAFQRDADRVASFCAIRLGYPLMDVELDSGSFYACFEKAVMTCGTEIYKWKIIENMLSLEGQDGSKPINGEVLLPTLHRVVEIGRQYGQEALLNGDLTLYSDMLHVTESVQKYDLDAWATGLGITGSIDIRRIFYQEPPAISRYFDPFLGTGTGVQALFDSFDFGAYSPGVNFLLMPISYDVSLTQAIEFNDQIRRSAYSFTLRDNQLEIFPFPERDYELKIEYFLEEDKAGSHLQDTGSIENPISNPGDVPVEMPIYEDLNAVLQNWIFSYTLALAKENLAYIRGKYQDLPVPGETTRLNYNDLLSDARAEKEFLLTELSDWLKESNRNAQLEKKARETDYLSKTLEGVPMKIWIL